jgi:hypothetical protein
LRLRVAFAKEIQPLLEPPGLLAPLQPLAYQLPEIRDQG